MAPSPAPACRALLNQATARWPGRRKASDGIMSSDAHKRQNPRSDHDHGLAVDLTHDPERGVDCSTLARWIVDRAAAGLDPRPTYVIWDRRIASARHGWAWRAYTGPNPHTKHLHVSIRADQRDNTAPWFEPARIEPHEPPPPAPEVPDVTPDECRKVVREELDRALPALLLRVTGGRRVRAADGTVIDPDKDHVSIADVMTALDDVRDGVAALLARET